MELKKKVVLNKEGTISSYFGGRIKERGKRDHCPKATNA